MESTKTSHFAVPLIVLFDQIIFRTDLIDSNATGNESVVNSMKKSYLQSTKKVSRSRTELRQLPTSYSLIFNDITVFCFDISTQNNLTEFMFDYSFFKTVRSLGKQPPTKNISSDMMDIILPCDDQATSINKVYPKCYIRQFHPIITIHIRYYSIQTINLTVGCVFAERMVLRNYFASTRRTYLE